MSTPREERSAPSLERLRKEAKKLLRQCHNGDPAALARVRAGEAAKLADVQHALAREHGYESWAALKHDLEARSPLAARIEAFFAAVRDHDPERALGLLARHPEIATTDLHAACVAGRADTVAAMLAERPERVDEPHAPDGWPPLAYACAGRGNALATARVLVERGAKLDALPGAMPPLYLAFASGNRDVARYLLERGADPDDGESIYHMAEHDDRESLELLRAHGVDVTGPHAPWGNTPLYFLAGYRESHPASAAATRGMRWLLEHGADPNVPSGDAKEMPLHRMVELGRGAEAIELFLAHGADPALARGDGRTPYVLAVRAGNASAAEIFRARGAAGGDVAPVDELLGAGRRGDLAEARRILARHPRLFEQIADEDRGAVAQAAEDGREDAVRALVAVGFDPAWEGPWGGTPLHHAAWRGNLPLVRALLELGAPVDVRDRQFGSTPIAWAAHGSRHFRPADDDYIAIVDLLLAAGSTLAPSYNKAGEPPHALASPGVARHLREKGFVPGP